MREWLTEPALRRPIRPRVLLDLAPGYKVYLESSLLELRRLLFIRRAQGVGFSPAEIRELLTLRVHDPRSCAAVSRRVEAKITATEEKIRELRRLLKSLNGVRASCAARKRTEDCPVLEALVEDA